MKRTVVIVLLASMIASGVWAAGQGEAAVVDPADWPGEPITMICPWAAGGIADLSIRAIAEYGEKYFGYPIVPVVRTGAGGAIAITEFKRHRPNAPQIIMASEGLFAITPLTNEVDYAWEDYVPVIGNAYSAFTLVTSTDSGLDTLEDLIEYGRENTITIAITGNNLLYVGAFAEQAGLRYETVPYSGAAEQLAAVLAGDVTVAVTHPALAKEHARAGRVTALTVFDDEPWQDEFYDIPPITSFGYDVVFPNLNFFLMPAGTDPEIVARVHDGIAAIYEEPEFREVIETLNIVIRPVGREEIEAHIDNAISKATEYFDIVY